MQLLFRATGTFASSPLFMARQGQAVQAKWRIFASDKLLVEDAQRATCHRVVIRESPCQWHTGGSMAA
jgi:hypothetical protein